MTGFAGSFTIQVTPFTERGDDVDLPAQRRFVDWQLANDVPGLILFGTIGEFWSVNDSERAALLEATVERVAGRIPVLAGVAAIDTASAARLATEAEKGGADGLMISPPFYVNATDEEIERHIGRICEVTSIPVMLYNNPHTCNVDMSAGLVARLAKSNDSVRYIKEASSDVGRVYDVVEASEGLVAVFAGERIVESHLLGAVGYTSALGSYTPRASVRIWQLLDAGRTEEARRIQRRLDRMGAIIADGHPLYGHTAYTKQLTRSAGFPMGEVRPPLTRLDQLVDGRQRLQALESELQELEELLDHFPVSSDPSPES